MGFIRIMMSSRVLLDLEKADQIFKDKGLEAYRRYMIPRKNSSSYDQEVGGRRLKKGPLFDFAVAALELNRKAGYPVVEIGLSCKDEADTAVPIFRSLDVQGLGEVQYRIAKSGHALSKADHVAFDTDLLLSRNAEDVQNAINSGIAAASIHTPPKGFNYSRNGDPIQLWVDGDAVAFGSSSEVRYRTEGLEIYRELEDRDFNEPIEPGPFTEVLAKISELNKQFPKGEEPFEIALVTARGGNAGARALTIATHHGINFNGGTYFMGGSEKVNTLKAHRPDIFFDDQMVHLSESAKYCPTGLVAYEEGSPMFLYTQEQKAASDKAKSAKVAKSAFKESSSPNAVKKQSTRRVHKKKSTGPK
jgi:5'-nucleotidase